MKKPLYAAVFLLASLSAYAQQPQSLPPNAKKKLTHDVYDGWKEIPDKQISPDGNHIVYALNPQEGDGRVVIYTTKTAKEDSVRRGADITLTDDSQFAVFKIKPQLALLKDLKRKKKKKEDMPKDSLAIYALKTGVLTKIPNIVSVKLPEKQASWVAYQTESIVGKNATPKGKAKKESETNGYKLVVQKLTGQTKVEFGFVTEYDFSKFGQKIVFSTTGNDSTLLSGVYVYDVATGNLQNVFQEKGKFKKLSLSQDANQVAFIADLDTNAKTLVRLPKLFYWKSGMTTAQKVVDESQSFAPAGWLLSENYQPKFSKNGQRLFFGTNPRPIVQDTSLLAEEIVNVEVWHWQDKKLQTQQKVTLEEDKKRSYLAYLNLIDMKVTQIGTKDIPQVSLDKEIANDILLMTTDVPYSQEHWDWNTKRDVYLFNLNDGSKKQIAKALQGMPNLSPNANFVTWWSLSDTAWFSYSVKMDKLVKLTDNKVIKWYEEDDDHPDLPPSYGMAGWLNDQEKPLLALYERFDIWLFDPFLASKPVQATLGRLSKTRMRAVNLDTDSKFVDLRLVTTFNETTKSEGYAKLGVNAKGVWETKKLVEEACMFSNPIKAKQSDKIIFTKQNFQQFPNIYLSDLSYKTVQKVSEANPQQAEYLWGTVELVNWQSIDNKPLQGLLYKPENFDANKKYPMIVYYYERNSDNLHNHIVPAPIRSYINYSYFTSNGSIVFVPDIIYTVGEPGKNAYNCIIPGVEKLISQGFVNKDRIGISGHSWGGYQTAYLVTQTNIFRAAEAGAPVSNMTSAYGGIRWDSGLLRQAQYERTQSRIGGTLWEKFDKYVENSPLFFAPKVQTPLLMMHNDDDGAVPWYQGIEYYAALKRLNKPVWMLNYNGEKHGLTLRKNRKDFAKRMYQFFDHYLKDAPAPLWMTEGLPMIEKGINQKLELNK